MVQLNIEMYSGNIAERYTFSSFSSQPFHRFGVTEIARPYYIVALPGYKIPQDLHKESHNALWLEKAPTRPTIVWDGYCPYALHEVIYECFGFRPGEIEGKICVIDAETKRMVRDDRDPGILSIRPHPRTYVGKRDFSNHVADLLAWSAFFDRTDRNGKRYTGNGGNRTVVIYDDLYTFWTPRQDHGAQSVDSREFDHYYGRQKEFKVGNRIVNCLSRGPTDLPDDKETIERNTGYHVRKIFGEIGPDINDVLAMPKPRGSLYVMSLEKDRDPVTGNIYGMEEAIMKEAKNTRLYEMQSKARAEKERERRKKIPPLPTEKVTFGSLMDTILKRNGSH